MRTGIRPIASNCRAFQGRFGCANVCAYDWEAHGKHRGPFLKLLIDAVSGRRLGKQPKRMVCPPSAFRGSHSSPARCEPAEVARRDLCSDRRGMPPGWPEADGGRASANACNRQPALTFLARAAGVVLPKPTPWQPAGDAANGAYRPRRG